MQQNKDTTTQYYVYARKSTESEDRQILSLPSQIEEMTKTATRSGLKLYKTLVDSKSAKAPNMRNGFNEMMAGIRMGKAQGIICWKLDRLARNPDEAGMIMGMLQRSEIRHIKTSDKDYYPEDNSLLSYVEFGIANQFSRDLGKNVKRGLDKKANAGIRPTRAPLGYLNSKTSLKGEQTIYNDPQRFTLVRQLWDAMLTGNYSVREIKNFANETLHLTQPATRKIPERKLSICVLYKMFTNSFYYGFYRWPLKSSNWIKGTHETIISESEFDQVQKILGRAGRPRPQRHKFAFTGLMNCGNCGARITAEEKIKKQQNGKIHYYVYYHCTKKINPNCPERCINLTELNKQVDKILEGLHISEPFQKWALKHLHELRKNEAVTKKDSLEAKQKLVVKITQQLNNLLLKYTAPENENGSMISDEEYQSLKSSLAKEKVGLEQELKAQGSDIDEWLELSERTFNFARYARFWFEKGDTNTKRAIFACLGSNFLLQSQKISFIMKKPLKFIFEGLSQTEAEILRLEPPEIASNIIDYGVLTRHFSLISG